MTWWQGLAVYPAKINHNLELCVFAHDMEIQYPTGSPRTWEMLPWVRLLHSVGTIITAVALEGLSGTHPFAQCI